MHYKIADGDVLKANEPKKGKSIKLKIELPADVYTYIKRMTLDVESGGILNETFSSIKKARVIMGED